jgi:hypothetical protein
MGGGSTVDVRSKSRDGKGDLGVNANRIRRLRGAAGDGALNDAPAVRLLRWLVVLVVVAAAATYAMLGGGMRMPDASTQPILGNTAVEKVVDLSYPPGNIAVSRTGRRLLHVPPRRPSAVAGDGAEGRSRGAVPESGLSALPERAALCASTARIGSGCSTSRTSVAAARASWRST